MKKKDRERAKELKRLLAEYGKPVVSTAYDSSERLSSTIPTTSPFGNYYVASPLDHRNRAQRRADWAILRQYRKIGLSD